MPESAEEMYARVLAAHPDGRPPMPAVAAWRTFPFEGDVRVRALVPPLDAEPVRSGTDAATCWCTTEPDRGVIWRDETWRVSAPDSPSGLPVLVFLAPLAHLDLEDLDDDLAASYGLMTARLVRALSSLPHVGRVHVSRWGDGSAHLHVWFYARTARVQQTMGTFAAVWDDLLPPVPEDVWRADLRAVAAALATGGGTALV